MAINKNFVVKNGLEIATDLIFADSLSNKAGIGTTSATHKLDVNGDTSVSGDFRATGIATVGGVFDVGIAGTALRVDNGTGRVGVNTGSPEYNFEVIGNAGISSHFNVGGITTSNILHVTGLTSSVHLNVTGVTTIADARINAGFVTSSLLTTNLLSATNADVTGVATVGGAVTMSSTGIDVNNIDVEALTGRDIDITGNIDATTYTGNGSAISGIVTTIVAGENISISGGTGTVTITGLAKTDNINAETLVVSGITTLGFVNSGIITGSPSIGVGKLYATQLFGDGSNLTGIDTSGNFQGKTIVCENVLASNPGVGTFGSVVINNPAGRITATEFYGDGANLTNTGSTLEGINTTERLVTTGINTGSTMVSSGSTSTMTYNPTTDTLFCTNFSGNGANLTNTGSALGSGSGVERLVTTSLTSGTMTSSSTDPKVVYDFTNDRLGVGTNSPERGFHFTTQGLFGPVDTTTEYQGFSLRTGLDSSVSEAVSFIDSQNNVGQACGHLFFRHQTNGECRFQIGVTPAGDRTTDRRTTPFTIFGNGNATFIGTVTASSFSGTLDGGDVTAGSIPNTALANSTISGVSLGSNLATLTRGNYLTGSDYNGSTAGTWAVDATSANTASKVVARDGSGNFSAGTITGTLSGTATNATNVDLRARNTTNAVHYITFSTSSTGNQRLNTDTTLKYNPNTNTLSVTNFDGNATTATNATNAGTLDGYDSSQSATGSTVAVRDGSGHLNVNYLYSSYVNMTNGRTTRNSDDTFYSSTDDFIRKTDATGMRASLNVPTRTGGNASGTWGISISGNAVTASSATNADMLDNIDSSGFLRSDTSDIKTSGDLRFNDNIALTFGSDDDAQFFCSGTHFYLDLESGIGNFYIRDGNTNRFTFDDAGHFTATGDIIANSDIKLKKNIETLENPIEKVKQLRGVRYDRVDIEKDNCIGVIAQEVEEIYPEFVSEGEDGTKGVDYSKMVAVLIEAVKEQQKQIEELKSIINK